MRQDAKILVIDDDERYRQTLETILTRSGYQVTGAADAPQALELVKSNAFDIILSDVRLPGGEDGRDLLQKIRAVQNQDVKMILMTGFSEHHEPEKAQELGVVSYLIKPFKSEALLDIIEKSLET